jgi:hypothetical protein
MKVPGWGGWRLARVVGSTFDPISTPLNATHVVTACASSKVGSAREEEFEAIQSVSSTSASTGHDRSSLNGGSQIGFDIENIGFSDSLEDRTAETVVILWFDVTGP